MNRIDKRFKKLNKEKKSAFIAYITAGYPNLSVTRDLILELERNGADIIELGIPFSDPVADGPVIQAASQAALKNNISLDKVISLVRDIRKKSEIPLVFMTYYNPVYHFGVERFVKTAAAAGVDGVIIPDLPPEEAKGLTAVSKRNNLANIFLAAPTSSTKRIKIISKVSTGFIYYVSLTGTTGMRNKLPKEIRTNIHAIKKFTKKPVCIGFGVSNSAQARDMAKLADGVIVGSAIVKTIEHNLGKRDLVKSVGIYIQGLSNAVHQKKTNKTACLRRYTCRRRRQALMACFQKKDTEIQPFFRRWQQKPSAGGI